MRTYRRVRPNLIPFVDYHTNILLVFVLLLVFSTIKKADESIPLSEIYELTMTWDGKSNTDMDLWAQDPTGNIVGFKRTEGGEGSLFCLKRDDVGKLTDKKPDGTVIEINEEIVSLRGTKEGEYIVNGHLYKRGDGEETITVKAKLTKVKPYKEIIIIERTFKMVGEEQTFFRFMVDDKCEVTGTNELQGKIAIRGDEEGEVDFDDNGPQFPSSVNPNHFPLPQ
jgi:hypothetical protein